MTISHPLMIRITCLYIELIETQVVQRMFYIWYRCPCDVSALSVRLELYSDAVVEL